MISYQIGSLITNNQDALMNVCIYNKFNELYINNAIYYNTIEQTNDFAEILKEAAEEKHGKPVLRINPVRKNMITFARNIYVPQIEKVMKNRISDDGILTKRVMEKSYRQERIEM